MMEISKPSGRLASLDFLRGLTMVFLTLESTRLFEHLDTIMPTGLPHVLLIQLFHHPWHGLRFWDLIQPVFMFVAGTSLAFSMQKQRRILTWNQSFHKKS